MDPSFGLAAFIGGLIAGSLLLTLAIRWAYAVMSEWWAYRESHPPAPSPAGILGVAFLHSGPWALAIAAYVAFRVLSAQHADWWTWFFVGAAAGPLLILARAWAGRGRPRNDVTLTAELLGAQKRRALWVATLLFGGAGTIGVLVYARNAGGLPLWFVLLVASASALAGYVFGLVMWQWEKSILEAREYQRRKALRV